jgi:antitoxin component of RelBE/YafQ-DinJ toxin-antitoxin module
MPKRVKQYTMRLNDKEYARIKQLAERDGVSMSDAVRMLVKREDDRLKAEKEAKR